MGGFVAQLAISGVTLAQIYLERGSHTLWV